MYIEFPDLDFQLVIAIYPWEKNWSCLFMKTLCSPLKLYWQMAPTLTTVSVFKHSELFKYTFKPWADCKKKPSIVKETTVALKWKAPFTSLSHLTETAVKLCAFETHISQKQRESSWIETSLNPLSANSNQKQFSPNNIHTLSRGMVMRINKMITKGKMPWSFIKINSLK